LAEPDARGIRVGFLTKSALTKVEEISDFPDGLSPVQVDDEGGTIEQMGRSAHVSEKAARRSTSSQSTSNPNCCRTPAVDSRPGMKANVQGTPSMLSTDEQQRHPQSAPERLNCSVVTDARTESSSQAISMTNLRPPRRRFCSALVARSSARPASIGLTRVMLIECGTWNC
jgi:Ca2+-dependent lipid-binding protein